MKDLAMFLHQKPANECASGLNQKVTDGVF
jgi:hypothetical protein